MSARPGRPRARAVLGRRGLRGMRGLRGGVFVLGAGVCLSVSMSAAAAPSPTPTASASPTASPTAGLSRTPVATPTATTSMRSRTTRTSKTKPVKTSTTSKTPKTSKTRTSRSKTTRTSKTKPVKTTRTTSASVRPTSQSCTVRYVLVSAWAGGFQGSLVVTHALDLAGWTLAWDFPGTQKITQVLLAEGAQAGTRVTVTDPVMPAVEAERPLVLDFVAEGDADSSTPRSVTLNGIACS